MCLAALCVCNVVVFPVLPPLHWGATKLRLLRRLRDTLKSIIPQSAPLLPATVIFPFYHSKGASCTVFSFFGQQITC